MKPTAIDLMPSQKTKATDNSTSEDRAEYNSDEKMPLDAKVRTGKLLLVGTAGLFLIICGLGAAAYMGYLPIPLPLIAQETKLNKGATPQPSIGPMVKLNPLVINLKDEKGRHYVKIRLVLEAGRPEWVEEINSRLPLITDIVILTLSDKRLADLQTPGAMETLKKDFLRKFNQSFQRERISQIYFDEFIYQ